MPLFMVKREYFEFYLLDKKDVELRAVRPQWRNCKEDDMATIQCGKDSLRRKIEKVHRGSLARIFKDVDYKRIFPQASTVIEAVRIVQTIYPTAEDFMAFEMENYSE